MLMLHPYLVDLTQILGKTCFAVRTKVEDMSMKFNLLNFHLTLMKPGLALITPLIVKDGPKTSQKVVAQVMKVIFS